MKNCTLEACLAVESITCDICYRVINSKELEFDECVCISHITGKSSTYGDGKQVNIDICQHCFDELLGAYADISDANNWECPSHRKVYKPFSE